MRTKSRSLLAALFISGTCAIHPARADVATITANGLYSSCAAFVDQANKGARGMDLMSGPASECWAVVAVEAGARAMATDPGFCSPRVFGEGVGAWVILAGRNLIADGKPDLADAALGGRHDDDLTAREVRW